MKEVRRPWFKFYVDSWRADELLRMCGLQARGLWVEMLAVMHKATPYGHLLVNGIQPSLEDLARLAGAPVKDTRAAMAELESKSVFSRTENGTIYSRKMVRDEVASQEGRENVGKRWANRGPDVNPNSIPTRDPNRVANSTDDRGQIKEPVAKATGKKTRAIKTSIDPEFQPDETSRGYATKKGLNPDAITPEFINFWLGDGGRKSNWQATYRSRCDQISNQGRARGYGQRSGSPGGGSLSGALRNVLAASGDGGLRASGISRGEGPYGAGTGDAADPFAELDKMFGQGIRQPGSDAVLIVDQEPVEG